MDKKTQNIALMLLALSTGLLGISMLLMGSHGHIKLITDFFSLSDIVSGDTFNTVAALSFLLVTALSLLAIKKQCVLRHLAVTAIVVSAIPLLGLFSEKMWIGSLGGFPAIGAGQGVIKYFALLAIGILLFKPELPLIAKKLIAAFPVILVLVWIGGMKFTEIEAKGIEDLVVSSPLMSWMYSIWDVQTTSNLIGVYDLIAAVLVLATIFKPRLLLPAVVMSGAVFIVTQTFFFSWDGALSSETLLSTSGHFLIKDVWFIINLVFLVKFVSKD
ncbi:MAG: DUF417 family protein [Parashewanella sp.]